MESYRSGQKEVIEAIISAFDNGKKFFLAECPTGSGKSAIAYTVARYFASNYWITIQKSLQDQIVGDFGQEGKHRGDGPAVVDLKGRGTYECTYYERILESDNKFSSEQQAQIREKSHQWISCASGYCKSQGKSNIDFCDAPADEYRLRSHCPYWDRKFETLASPIAILNFSSFLFQTVMTNSFETRDLLIIDEAHQSESELMKFVEFTISDKEFRKWGIKFPKLDTPMEYAEYFRSINLGQRLSELRKLARFAEDRKKETEYESYMFKLASFYRSIKDEDSWIIEYKTRDDKSGNVMWATVSLKPLFVGTYAHQYLFSMADKVLLMSGTILSPKIMRNGLSIPADESASYRMSNKFPVGNRQIYYDPVGSLSYKNKKDTFPHLVRKINEICNQHKNVKGIIHTHSFEIAYLLRDSCDNEVCKRFLLQNNFKTKTEMLSWHARCKDTILVAPAMHEGLDLHGDLSRFQIICKVPYPSLGDPQIKARLDKSPGFYDWMTAQKLCQSLGRSIRSEVDWAETFILDSDFGSFRRRARKLLPTHVKEAIVDV